MAVNMQNTLKISLGPLLYCWSKEKVTEFYQHVAESNIPLVYLGEAVCSRRREMKFADYFAIAQQLRDSGKQVVLSTLALIEAPSEFTELSKHIDNGEFAIEANDMGAVSVAKSLGLPFICGPTINNYNLATLNKLATWGMQRFVMPVELSKHWLAHILANRQQQHFEAEVFGHGYLPLAHSARCFTARQLGRQKDGCQIACIKHSKGLLAQTQENQPLLRINGIQTQSAQAIDLTDQLQSMQTMGVDYFRVSPSSLRCIELAQRLINAETVIERSDNQTHCDGYWHGKPGFTLGAAV
ncbi:U32 family peptidase [Shewanella waksmanii]|uniref:U32 family peptidase n=1 Tax=Shewanella waksmanii TaxID=213783 RepID=UPI003736A4C3